MLSKWAVSHTADERRQPTPLDALLVSHLYVIYSLSDRTPLRIALEENAALSDYVERVLERAGRARV
jgi:hypothetical protein